MLYMVTFTINMPPMLAYIPYMDPMGYDINDIKVYIYIYKSSTQSRAKLKTQLVISATRS